MQWFQKQFHTCYQITKVWSDKDCWVDRLIKECPMTQALTFVNKHALRPENVQFVPWSHHDDGRNALTIILFYYTENELTDKDERIDMDEKEESMVLTRGTLETADGMFGWSIERVADERDKTRNRHVPSRRWRIIQKPHDHATLCLSNLFVKIFREDEETCTMINEIFRYTTLPHFQGDIHVPNAFDPQNPDQIKQLVFFLHTFVISSLKAYYHTRSF